MRAEDMDMRRLICSLFVSAAFVLPAAAASVDGLKIRSAVKGRGEQTVIFVHGWTCDSSSWAAQVPELSRKYRVVTLDLPGHGKSGSPADGRFSMDLFARAVEAVRVEVKADRVVLVGHSMGAPVIRQYARLYPQHVAALVAVDGPLVMTGFGGGARGNGPPRMTGPEGLKARESMIRGMFTPQTPMPLQQQILTMMLKAPEATAAGAMAAIFDPALRKEEVIALPALAVYAGTATVPNADDMKKIIPNFKAAQIAGTGHFLMMEKPKEFNRLLADFLATIKF
jgi:pimeloyl-ACP methyl ester carboxylesterase